MTYQLHDYQLVARDFLRGRNRCALFLDMGLGKTATSLAALEPRHLPVLVVAPKRVAETVWNKERDIWRPDLSLRVAKGDKARRLEALADEETDIIVLGRDNLRDLDSILRTREFQTVIIDELSGFKNRASIRWKTLRKHSLTVPHVWGLTGTPTPNGLMDLWAQIYLLDHGVRLGKNITTYRGRYFMPGRQLATGIITEWIPRPGADDRIHNLIDDICLAMETDGRVTLPPVTHNPVTVQMPQPVRKAYNAMSDTLVADLRSIFDGEVHSAANAAVLTSKLSQITAGFMYVDDADLRANAYTFMHSEKINAVAEIVESQGSPVLVFYRFQAELELLRRALPQARSIDERDVVDDWNEGRVPVLLAHPASAGHGLNLQHGGHTIVWTSLTWSLEEWEQGNKRLARQGQKHPVVIHRVMAEKSVDQLIYLRLKDKATVEDKLLEHLESPI